MLIFFLHSSYAWSHDINKPYKPMIKFLKLIKSAGGLKIQTNSNNNVVMRIFFYSIFGFKVEEVRPSKVLMGGPTIVFALFLPKDPLTTGLLLFLKMYVNRSIVI